jgi:Rieske Fe-S protein
MQPDRRSFVLTVAAAAAAYACSGCASSGSGAARDQVDDEVVAAKGPVDVGPASNFSSPGVSTQYAKSGGIFLVNNAGRLTAISSVCTHRHCLLSYKGNELRCPCHGSRFALDGRIVKGPATKPLPEFAIATGPDNHLIVDKSRPLAPGEGALSLTAQPAART